MESNFLLFNFNFYWPSKSVKSFQISISKGKILLYLNNSIRSFPEYSKFISFLLTFIFFAYCFIGKQRSDYNCSSSPAFHYSKCRYDCEHERWDGGGKRDTRWINGKTGSILFTRNVTGNVYMTYVVLAYFNFSELMPC